MFRKNEQVRTKMHSDDPLNGKLVAVVVYDCVHNEYRVRLEEDSLPYYLKGEYMWVLADEIEELCSN